MSRKTKEHAHGLSPADGLARVFGEQSLHEQIAAYDAAVRRDTDDAIRRLEEGTEIYNRQEQLDKEADAASTQRIVHEAVRRILGDSGPIDLRAVHANRGPSQSHF